MGNAGLYLETLCDGNSLILLFGVNYGFGTNFHMRVELVYTDPNPNSIVKPAELARNHKSLPIYG
jgi:aminoglycoside N3'-acetyltransferase